MGVIEHRSGGTGYQKLFTGFSGIRDHQCQNKDNFTDVTLVKMPPEGEEKVAMASA